MPDAQTLYEQGVAAAKAKDNARARQLLRDSLKSNPANERGWLWFARVVDDDETRLKAVQRALKLNPASEPALEMQRRLLTKTGRATAETSPVKTAPSKTKSTRTSEVPPVKAKTADVPAVAPVPDASAIPMGRELAVSGVRSNYRFRNLLGFITFGLFALIFLSNFLDYLAGISTYGLFPLMFLSSAVLCVCFLVVLLMSPFGKQFRIFENGLVYGGKKSGVMLRWQELDSVIKIRDYAPDMSFTSGRSRMFEDIGVYRLNGIKDGRVVFSVTRDYQGYSDLGKLIMRLSQPVLVDRALTEFGRTGQLAFDDIRLDDKGISQGSNSLAWAQVFDVTPFDRSVQVQTPDSKTIIFKPKTISGGVLADVILGIKHSV